MTTKELVLKYYNSWQVPTDLNEMASCFAENVIIDGGMFRTETKDDFIKLLKENHSDWKDVKMIKEHYDGNVAFILYEGFETGLKTKMRVSEHITIKDGLIVESQSVVSKLK